MTAEDIFDAEQKLRVAALAYTDWSTADPKTNPTRAKRLDEVRKDLRLAALAYASVANRVMVK